MAVNPELLNRLLSPLNLSGGKQRGAYSWSIGRGGASASTAWLCMAELASFLLLLSLLSGQLSFPESRANKLI